ncbi:MAG: hypothetical protein RI894_2587, partial [Bacteroidota bacterium]
MFAQILSKILAEIRKTAFWLALFAFLLPLSAKAAGFMIVFAVFAHFLNSENRKPFRLITPPLLYFLAYLASVFYSETAGSLHYALESRLPFVVFPLLFGASLLSQQQIENILKAFWLGLSVAIMSSETWACVRYWNEARTEYFFYLDLTNLLDFHPTYFSWYVCFGFFSGLVYLHKKWDEQSFFLKIMGILWLLSLATFNVF